METGTITIAKAYEKGMRDAYKGRSPNQIFFSDPKIRAAWLKGYEQAKQSKLASENMKR